MTYSNWQVRTLIVNSHLIYDDKIVCRIEALIERLSEKGIISKDELMAMFRKLDREMKEKGAM